MEPDNSSKKLIQEIDHLQEFTQDGHLPYFPYRKSLYSCEELMKGYDPDNDQSLDYRIYQHFSTHRHHPSINEALSQRIHDHSIDAALRALVGNKGNGMTEKRSVGIMGGHSVLRTDLYFQKVAFTAWNLAREGYFIVSGGGPGIMEAANLGAYFSQASAQDLQQALEILAVAPHYTDKEYLNQAYEVRRRFPKGAENLAIPTWFYGHEPSNLFATHIAKYFSNSIREDNLLAISLYGVVFAPGSAGTTQEIFQDAAQNHYGTFGYYSPMAFLGRERYEIQTTLFPMLKQLAWGKAYFDLLFLSDDPEQIVKFIKKHPPIPVK